MKNGIFKKSLICMLALILTVIAAFSGNAMTVYASQIDDIKKSGKLVIGTSADYPPYEFHATINGQDEIKGFDIEIAKRIAENLGVELEIKDMDFDGLLVALQGKKVDLVFAGMTPTEERKQNVDFSDIYYEANHLFVVKSDSDINVTSFDDLQGKRIGVQKGSIQEGIAKDNFPAENIKSLAKIPDLILDLQSGKVDAILMENVVALSNAEKNSNIRACTDFLITDNDGGNAIALRKGSKELKKEIDKTIKQLKDEGKIEQYVKEATELSAELAADEPSSEENAEDSEAEVKSSSFNLSFLSKYWQYFLKGAEITIVLALIAVACGTVLGLLLTLLRRSKFKILRALGTVYVEFVRGTPLLVQIYIIYIGLPKLLGFDIPDMAVGAIALSLNSSAYVSEIIRAGIEAVDKGQMEAARSLGMPQRMAMFNIVIPQAFKNILPALGNEFISVIKESSIVSVIGVAELMYNAGIVRGNTALGLEPMIIAAVLYFIMTFTLTRILKYVERRMKASDRK